MSLTADLSPPGTRLSLSMLQGALLWFVGAGGAIVFIEPSPYEIATLSALVLFLATGLRMRPMLLPLIVLLVVINLGYTICAAYLMNDTKIVNWILTSWYMAVTVIFFATVLTENTQARMEWLRRGLIAGALIASAAGIAGYFNLVPGGYDTLTLYGRARGTFKDPNVLSAFLILPALFCVQSIVTDRFAKAARSMVFLGVIVLAIFLAFSRAAWGQLVLTSAFMLLMIMLTSDSSRQRTRIAGISFGAIAVLAVVVVVLLSFDSVENMFKQRASFDQSYDEGRFGRFGRYLLGAQMALDLPLGIGPLQFTKYMPEDTHNSFLNAFMSGGWLAGISFPVLMIITLLLGFRHMMQPVPWQRAYLAVFAGFLGTVGEAFIIDVDHWRHFWMMLGMMWGMFAAAHAWRVGQANRSIAAILQRR